MPHVSDGPMVGAVFYVIDGSDPEQIDCSVQDDHPDTIAKTLVSDGTASRILDSFDLSYDHESPGTNFFGGLALLAPSGNEDHGVWTTLERKLLAVYMAGRASR